MRKEYLGDTFDYFKRAMLQVLQKDFYIYIDPIWTDQPNHLAYRKLLNIPGNHRRVQYRSENTIVDNDRERRLEYFGKWLATPNENQKHILFLDTDTGVEPPSGSRKAGHLRHEEIEMLLANHPNRILCIYQHAPRGKELQKYFHQVLIKPEDSLKTRLPLTTMMMPIHYRTIAFTHIGLVIAGTNELLIKKTFSIFENKIGIFTPEERTLSFPVKKAA